MVYVARGKLPGERVSGNFGLESVYKHVDKGKLIKEGT